MIIEFSEQSKNDPSDLSAKQFERIGPLLEASRAKTKPLEVDLHQVFNAVLSILKEGWLQNPSWQYLSGMRYFEH